MPNKIVSLPSGAKLEIQDPDFQLSTRFIQVLSNELKAINMTSQLGELSVESMLTQQMSTRSINDIKTVFLTLLGSEKLFRMVFELLAAGCLYNERKIQMETFDPRSARGDWLVVAWEVCKNALDPFAPSLDSLLSILLPKDEKTSPKSASPLPVQS